MNKDRYNKKDALVSLNSEFREAVICEMRNSILKKMDPHVRLEWMYVVSELMRIVKAGEFHYPGEIVIKYPGPEKFNYTYKDEFSDLVLMMLKSMGFSAKYSSVREDVTGSGHCRSVSVIVIHPLKIETI